MLALYRKYRPRTLAEVLGQPAVTEPLVKALQSGKISHSYILTGPRGCGKTSVARILAHEINGFKYELEDSHLDIIEIDAASNTGVDNIRELREKALIAPSEGKYKVYIIDEVHMLSKSAFNALLKTLEEPPAHVVFILATTDLEKVPITITSRSQVYHFRLVSEEVMLPHLRQICDAEKIKISNPALQVIATRGGGSFRDSLSLLDQISAVSDGKTELSEEQVSSLLGLPLNSAVSGLLSAYSAADAAALTTQLKSLLSEGLKPESLAEALIRQILAAPTPELLPLLSKLPSVSAPFPEAKLLVALLSGLKPENSFGLGRGSASSSEVNTKAETPPKSFESKKNVINQLAGTSGETRSFEGRPEAAAVPPLGTRRGQSPTDKRRSPVKTGATDAVRERIVDRKRAGEPSTLTSALQQQLSKCLIDDQSDTIHIYPHQKITKLILERQNNQELLKSYFTKPFVIHSPDDAPSKNSPAVAQISDIMGNVQEVNNNGGVPF